MQQERPFVDNKVYDSTSTSDEDFCDGSGYMLVVSVLSSYSAGIRQTKMHLQS